MTDLFAKLDEILQTGRRAALCIITETKGSTPRKAGSKMVVTEDGQIFGTIGGGSLEHKVVKEALAVCRTVSPVKINFDLEEDLSMSCGGMAEVYIEPLLPKYKLVIFGAGHVGAALGKYARDFGFEVTFVDDREDFIMKTAAQGFQVIQGDYISEAKIIDSDEQTFFVVVTPKHAFDHEVTGILGKKAFGYLGMKGSSRKVAEAKSYFLDNNLLTDTEIAKIDMPIGIKFNAQTPEEIAISILAKIIDTKNSFTS
jgi:xanthine dehydrogenase accessory factor